MNRETLITERVPARPSLRAAVLAWGLALGLAGCSTTQDAQRYDRQALIESFPVAIVAVDGVPLGTTSSFIEPGLRKLTVQMPKAAGFREGDHRVIDLDVKACTRYWLVAQRESRSQQPFEVRVDHEQRLFNCAVTSPTPRTTPLDAPASGSPATPPKPAS